MTSKEKLLQAIEQAPEPLLKETLHYLEFLTERYLEALENEEDLQDLKAIREEMKQEGTIPLSELRQELGL